jgi:site-specific recombinase XerD
MRRGVDVYTVRWLLGRSTIVTTIRHMTSNADLADVVDTAFPEAG